MIIYSNINKEDYYDKARLMLADELTNKERDEITKDDIENYVQSDMDDDWYNFVEKCLIGNICADRFLALGSVGRWDGTYHGWAILNDGRDFYKLIEDCDYIEIEDRDGRILVTGVHHDGTNQYELMRFTKEGFDFYMDHEELSHKEMLDALVKNDGIVIPHITWEY